MVVIESPIQTVIVKVGDFLSTAGILFVRQVLNLRVKNISYYVGSVFLCEKIVDCTLRAILC